MDEAIVDVVEGVLVIGKSKVALLIEPDRWGTEVLNQHPLPNIELPPFNQQRVFYVLLDDELGGLAQAIVGYVVDIIETSDSPSS